MYGHCGGFAIIARFGINALNPKPKPKLQIWTQNFGNIWSKKVVPWQVQALDCYQIKGAKVRVEPITIHTADIDTFAILVLRSEIASGMCAKLRTMAARNNRDYARNLSYYCLLALCI